MTNATASQKVLDGASHSKAVKLTNLRRKRAMATVLKEVSKKVKGPDGKQTERRAKISFQVPIAGYSEEEFNNKKYKIPISLDVDDATALFGGKLENLEGWATFGLWKKIQSDISNQLAQGDKASKQLEKAVKALNMVNPEMSKEEIRDMIMSNEKLRAKFDIKEQSGVLEIDIDLSEYETPPAITDEVATAEEDEEEEEEEVTQ